MEKTTNAEREPFAERRRGPREGEPYARRRRGQLLSGGAASSRLRERRRRAATSFDVAAAMELNLDRFSTKGGMLVLLRSWLHAAESTAIAQSRPGYVFVLREALGAVEASADPVQAISLLREQWALRIKVVASFAKRAASVP